MPRRAASLLASAAGSAAAAALVAAGTAAAAPKPVTVVTGDTFALAGTHVVCSVQVSRTALPGQTVVGCSLATGSRAIAGSYAVAIGTRGDVAIARVRPDRSAKVIYRRRPQVARAQAGRRYTVGVGTFVFVSGNDLTCSATRSAFGQTVSCFRFDLKLSAARARSYGVAISDRIAYVVRFDAKGRNPVLVRRVDQP
ncbi:MAG TPA: hypothetical protein VFA44_05520 [Gaiellaceae bacterium]|nr:hypothetical protein [Gaiellaceae bacterium]